MTGPDEFIAARANASTDEPFTVTLVHGKPYMPMLKVDPSSHESVAKVACAIVLNGNCDGAVDELSVTTVTGGITNALFKVSKCSSVLKQPFDSVLVRVFGAEGMIDRDLETSTYAVLCEAGVAPGYLGRFGNGRVERFLDDYEPLDFDELSNPDTSNKIATKMDTLHKFKIEGDLKKYYEDPGMWDQLFSWMEQAKTSSFRCDEDVQRAKALNLTDIEKQLYYLKEHVVPANASAVFCHNDLLAANIMKQKVEPYNIQLIDFEYGGINFLGFDIANHFNEWAGGTDDAKPDYSKFPTIDQQKAFVKAYLLSSRNNEQEESDDKIDELLLEVNAFVLANHLYWGLWAVNQAHAEGCDEFDYLLYAHNRFSRYRDEVKLLS